jgi:SNF2 family DNA or RNA helicase
VRLKTDLYTHQQKAVDKLSKIKIGALYMEMGTGKTRTALELISRRYNKGRVNHILWLCPCSVRATIRAELKKHVGGDVSMFSVYGIESLSSSDRLYLKLLQLAQTKNLYLIVDESNLVKNPKAIRTQRITAISKLCKYKLILNGTPISRNEADMFAQWYILDWRILGYQSYWSFAANHLEYDEKIPGRIRRVLEVDYLVRKIAPYTYQVKKSECLDLPKKTYTSWEFDMTVMQREHYQWALDEYLMYLDELKPETIYKLFTALQHIAAGRRVLTGPDEKMQTEPMFDNPMDSPRIQTLMDALDRIGEKVIIWCRYTHEIRDISKLLREKYGEGSVVEFHGGISRKKREINAERFANDARFFVANKTCAGYGLNLQFCSYMIYYSNDWDWATRSQSEDRVHRMGQTKNVHIIDIYAKGTIDERIMDCLGRKEDLVEWFKKEIERQKDIKGWLGGKSIHG